ncbi:homeobox-leucine zipper protein HAT3 [Dendrobium catenatum]|uniref:Homeobox-leucine zipper protein HAT2 n=1 Tax=Dendrobium catenatum TaxID=906689 RepID=A0A2I0WBZ4_9ASPA|nr:homeobox-leucine zipper protein HAT3 [Dendrobium catenatum]PKU73186.1 Homeobox-leucine zipper protein HAT2 [Dendrobium catenatum]
MVVEKEDLGLSLSLSSSDALCPLQSNLMPPATLPTEQRLMLMGGIDVNRAPMEEWEVEDDAGGSSPNSSVSNTSAGGKRGFGVAGGFVVGGEVVEGEQECSRGGSDEEDGEGARKKLRLSKEQSAVLEESFKEHNTLNPKQKLALAKQLNLRPRQVEVWFQNRRARTKLKQTEVDCEFLKRCCENLTEENRRLQKEVQELRALKLSPHFYMHMTPPTTLTMCPSCERVTPPPPAVTGEKRLIARPINAAAGVAPHWASLPLRPSFLDAPPQRH